MAKSRKDGKRVNFYMKTSITELLNQYCEKVGQTRTEAVERILNRYLQEYFAREKGAGLSGRNHFQSRFPETDL